MRKKRFCNPVMVLALLMIGQSIWSHVSAETFSPFKVSKETVQISGKVFNAKDNTPLENVTVKVVGTKKGTTTKNDGSFSITIEKGQSLEFSSVSMLSKTISKPDGRGDLVVTLQEAENNLSEVLVVAYSSQKRSSFTGSLSTVKNAAIESAPNASVQEILQ